jgi:hypothetical protein
MSGTVTISFNKMFLTGNQRKILTLEWVADDSDHTIPDTPIDAALYKLGGLFFYSAETIPGSGAEAPTNGYSITVNDTDGIDLAGGLLADRSNVNPEIVNIGKSSHGFPIVESNLVVSITGNLVNGATGVLILTFSEKRKESLS